MGVSVIQETLYLEKKEWKTVDLGSLSYLKKWAGNTNGQLTEKEMQISKV